jgi:hypothetical protein
LVLTNSDKIRRWVYWQTWGKRNYVLKQDFYENWEVSSSFRNRCKDELKKFVGKPLDYIKEDYNKTSNIHIERKSAIYESQKSKYFTKETGWLSSGDLKKLNQKGIYIKNNKLVDLSKQIKK